MPYGGTVKYEFLSTEWFAKVDELIAKAGDLKIPAEMKAVEVNITVKSAAGDKQIFLKDGLFSPGHQATASTKLTLGEDLARKIFIEADAAAGVQAFLAGEMQVEGDMAKLVAMQTVEPSEPQKQLTKQIAAITV
jgi:putative sterol carrier protein